MSYKDVYSVSCVNPPTVGYLQDLETPLANLLPLYEHVVIMVDFNTNQLNTTDSDTRTLCEMFHFLDIHTPTKSNHHHTATSNTQKLDHILTDGEIPAPGILTQNLI